MLPTVGTREQELLCRQDSKAVLPLGWIEFVLMVSSLFGGTLRPVFKCFLELGKDPLKFAVQFEQSDIGGHKIDLRTMTETLA